jgi:hypothetical protein
MITSRRVHPAPLLSRGVGGATALAILAIVLVAAAAQRAAADPIEVVPISAGSGSQSAYVQIEFFEGDAYLFEVFFDGGGVTTFDLLLTLEQDIGLTLEYIDFAGFGPFVTALGWDGHFNSGDGSGGHDFWHSYVRDSQAAAWDFAQVGVDGRVVFDGSWDAFIFGRDDLPIELVPVPAPPAAAALALLALSARRRRDGRP